MEKRCIAAHCGMYLGSLGKKNRRIEVKTTCYGRKLAAPCSAAERSPIADAPRRAMQCSAVLEAPERSPSPDAPRHTMQA